MAAETLDRYPKEPTKPLSPPRELWYTALVRIVNGLVQSAIDLAVLIAANTASIVTNTAAITANAAAIVLLQPLYGTWTPTDVSGATLTFTTAEGRYIKIGQLVQIDGFVVYPVTASGATAAIGSFPFTQRVSGNAGSASFGYNNTSLVLHGLMGGATTSMTLFTNAGAGVTNTQMSGKQIVFSITYRTT